MVQEDNIGVLCFGDVVGKQAREALKAQLPSLVKHYDSELVVVNAENISGGVGVNPQQVEELREVGVNVITLGDHTWKEKSISSYLDSNSEYCLRPENFGNSVAGRGWTKLETKSGHKVGVFNLIGRVFMNGLWACPFQAADRILSDEFADTTIKILDFHAEASSEKYAMGNYLDGRISLFFGTHTHVQTADEQILAKGTGFISDLGMCGPQGSVIGMDKEVAIERFLRPIPKAYKLGVGPIKLSGISARLSTKTGHCLAIERVSC